jgi:fatty acid synthase subunit alpha, fungi type
MKAIFPQSIDGDLLKLVHLTNGFRLVGVARPLKVGDVCKAEARIVSVTNTDAGKAVKVKGFVTRDSQPIIEVVSSFLYRGKFEDYKNTFELLEEPDYLVEITSDAAVGVLKSKEWFDWHDETKPLQPGTTLVFRVKSEVTYRNKTCYKSVSVSGDIFVRDQIKRLVKVGSVDFVHDDSRGNPVVEYLHRHGQAQGQINPLPNDGYTMFTPPDTTVFTSPATNEPYSKVSGDFNPIHINPYFSDYASLPGTITHGMWSSAATRRYIETVVAQGKPDRVIA